MDISANLTINGLINLLQAMLDFESEIEIYKGNIW